MLVQENIDITKGNRVYLISIVQCQISADQEERGVGVCVSYVCRGDPATQCYMLRLGHLQRVLHHCQKKIF